MCNVPHELYGAVVRCSALFVPMSRWRPKVCHAGGVVPQDYLKSKRGETPSSRAKTPCHGLCRRFGTCSCSGSEPASRFTQGLGRTGGCHLVDLGVSTSHQSGLFTGGGGHQRTSSPSTEHASSKRHHGGES